MIRRICILGAGVLGLAAGSLLAPDSHARASLMAYGPGAVPVAGIVWHADGSQWNGHRGILPAGHGWCGQSIHVTAPGC